MKAIVRKEKQRSAIGKQSNFRIHGRDVKYTDVLQYWKRKRLSVDDVLTLCCARETTPESLQCYTPVQSPVSTPRELEIPERLLRDASSYFRSTLEHYNNPQGRGFIMSTAFSYAKNTRTLNAGVNEACILFNCGKYEEGGRRLSLALARLNGILISKHPLVVTKLMRVMDPLERELHPKVWKIIMRHIARLSKIVCGPTHPISIIFALSEHIGFNVLQEVAERACHHQARSLQERFGILDPLTLDSFVQYWFALNNLDTKILSVREIASKFDPILLAHRTKRFLCHEILCNSYIEARLYAEAEVQAHSILHSIGDLDELVITISRASAYYLLARIKTLSHQYSAGSVYLRTVIGILSTQSSDYNAMLTHVMSRLETALLVSGQVEEAKDVERQRLAILQAELEEDELHKAGW